MVGGALCDGGVSVGAVRRFLVFVGRRPGAWSLRRQVVVLSGIFLTVLLGIGLVLFVIALRAVLVQSASDATLNQTYQLAQAVRSGDTTPVHAVQRAAPGSTMLQALSRDGRVLAASGNAFVTVALVDPIPGVGNAVTQQHEGFLDLAGDSDAYVASAQTVVTPGGEQVTLVVAQPLEVESHTIEIAVMLLAVASVVLVGVVLVLVDRVLRRALEPVRRITEHAAHITRARTSERVVVPPTGDDIAVLAMTVNEMLDRLARAEETTQRFVSDASHELRSPLAAVRTHVEIAERGAGLDLPLVRAEVMRVQALVEDLLTLAKSDDEGLRLVREPLDLDEIVSAEARHLRVVTDARVEVVLAAAEVWGDGARLGQVLRNLTENARRHTSGVIRLVMEVDGQVVRVHVDNSGAPVPEKDRLVIFDRFARLDAARERDLGGSGLGLAIARTVAELHGGSLVAGVAPEGWCRFSLTLPLV
ncbi:HAMP domain-containing histidine kinase [Dermatophilus congolensis]|uniref:histidine kinase n=1 Tax=Dermatophilus congolensis TaxID=1863 RepID=A0A239V6R9_9MICO|nr:HAMP domain-containing sensor histidine kinase [Dermatophilus congolensis]MBO3130338.1 HAMP domain-containing histidine kinase [Dermatophilus congolensis]MBO3131031.1 HAMP domain-containing histidine kinase [Dermatophilus congolensis]MBO3164713.1 HAMP domain-containing histidine kinase [Dermatophilus congolensis]MBO3171518.1 HAMP domain-containing histidine kinase [Dermatophilus congolensis]MBO3191075.1 HAMP domain-containing histidine kinase [Dermatophilus congolensis]